jgi:hypothetical protein
LLPEIVTVVPTRTFVFGVRAICGTTVRIVAALSPRPPVTVTVLGPRATPEVSMTNEPVTMPPVTEHEGVPYMKPVGVIEQLASPELNPEPETVIVSPPVPLVGESEIEGAVTVNVSDTGPETGSVTVIVCGPVTTGGDVLMTKLPVRSPLASTLQLMGGAAASNGSSGIKLSGGFVLHAKGPVKPDPESVTVRPGPPFLFVAVIPALAISLDCTKNCAVVLSSCS